MDRRPRYRLECADCVGIDVLVLLLRASIARVLFFNPGNSQIFIIEPIISRFSNNSYSRRKFGYLTYGGVRDRKSSSAQVMLGSSPCHELVVARYLTG